jgi:hypothetical protein
LSGIIPDDHHSSEKIHAYRSRYGVPTADRPNRHLEV